MENKFTVGVEKMINPVDVGTLHFVQKFTGALPLSIQKKMVDKSSDITPYMGFVVEPYSFFLNYEIKDMTWAEKLLPEGFKLIKTSIFENDSPKYYGIFGIFNAHTSGFWGLRVEFYLIAEDQRTGMLSWIIIDYDSNTISYDPKNGLRSPNAEGSIFTIDYDGIIHVDVKRTDKSRSLKLRSNIKNANMKPLSKRLWVEGNLSVGYGKEVSDSGSNVFSLKFDSKEFEKALFIDHKDLDIELNSWFPGLLEDQPSVIACFPYAQHFLSDSPGYHSQLKNEVELKREVDAVDFSSLKVFSTKSFQKFLLLAAVLSLIINITLLTLLILT